MKLKEQQFSRMKVALVRHEIRRRKTALLVVPLNGGFYHDHVVEIHDQ